MSQGCSLEPWPRRFKAVADFDSRDGEKTNSAANRLVVVVIAKGVEFKLAGIAGIEAIETRTVGNIKGVVRAGRTDGNSSAHFEADRYIWQDAVVDGER